MNELRRPIVPYDIPDIVAERFVLGELPPSESARVAAAIDGNARLRAHVDELRQPGEAADLSGWLLPGVKARLDEMALGDGTRTWYVLRWVTAAVAVLVLAVVMMRTAATPDGDRIKGPAASLTVYRQTATGSEQLDDGAVAHTGDVIRLGYRVNAAAYGLILSIDGRGVVTVHHPGAAATAASLQSGAVILLDQAYELDDAPRRERFYLITASKPFAIEPIVSIAEGAAAARDMPSLPLSRELEQSTFLLQKESRP